MRVWHLLGVMVALLALCGAQLPTFSGIATLLQPFIPTKLSYGGTMSGTLAAVGLGLFEAGVLAGYITNYAQLVHRGYDQERKKKKEALEAIKKEQESKRPGGQSEKSAYVNEQDYEDAYEQTPSRPYHVPAEHSSASSSSQDVYRSPSSQDVYRSPSSQDVYRSPSSQVDYRSPSSQDVYRSPSSQDDYRSPSSPDIYRSPSSQDDYRSPSSQDVYRSPSSHDVYRSPSSHDDYRSTSSQDDYRSPSSQDAYRSQFLRRQTRSNRQGLEQVDEVQKLLMSAATHLDTDGCVLKLLCHLDTKQQEERTLEENVLLHLFYHSPETLSSYNTELLKVKKTGQAHDQAACDKVFSRCPMRALELGSHMRQLWGCGASPP